MSEKNLKNITMIEEIKEAAQRHGVHLSDADLELIAGGLGTDFPPVDGDYPTCPNCGSSDVVKIGEFDGLVVLKCNKCGHIFLTKG